MHSELKGAIKYPPPVGYRYLAVDFDGVIHAYYDHPQKSFSCWISGYSSPISYYAGQLDKTIKDWADHCYPL